MKALKIRHKIVLYFIILITVFSLVNIIVYISSEYKHRGEDYKITGESLIRNAEPNIAEHIYLNDIVGQQRIINKIKESNKDVVYVFILNTDNKVTVSSFEEEMPSDLLSLNNSPESNIILLDFGKQSVYDFSYPIVDGKYGILRIGLSRERLTRNLRTSIYSGVFLLLFFLFLGIVSAYYISKRITNPLHELVDSANKISKGNFDHTIEIKSNDEVGILSQSFNSMCLNLNVLTKDLKEKIIQLNQKNNEYEALNEEYMAQNEDLYKAKEKAEESDKLKSVFLANLSHEIRTPMNGILGFADLLKEKDLSQEKQQAYLAVIEQSGMRMLNLIGDLVNISKIEAGQVEVVNENTDIDLLLEKIETFFIPQAYSKGILLNNENKRIPGNCQIISDTVKLEEIFTNLINNALKYTSYGEISFGYKIQEKEIQFWVRDTGRGIPEDMHELIFERFRQANNAHLNCEEGTGLGLSICKAYIELLGGKIWVESELKKGSTFYFTLPYIEAEIDKEKRKQNELLKEIAHDLTVLIAEDNETSFLYLNEILKNSHVNIIRANNGVEVLDYLNKIPDIKLILMDLKMPILNGIEATREIRKTNHNIPIIAQTAYASPMDEEKAMSAGCTDFISKPINKDELFEKINLVI